MPTTNHIAPPPCRLLSAMEEYLVDFNATSKRPMNLAMFLFAVEHVSVSRIHPPRICPGSIHTHSCCIAINPSP